MVLWVMAVKAMTIFFTKSMPINGFTKTVKMLVFTLIFVLPFADEIVDGFQFRALCEVETQLKYDEAKLANKTVYPQTINLGDLKGMTVLGNAYAKAYVDAKTHELLLSYKVLHADGGWLSRAIAFNSVHQPYTFNGHCGPGAINVQRLLKSLNVTVIQKPSGE
jgi:hypothetical protein